MIKKTPPNTGTYISSNHFVSVSVFYNVKTEFFVQIIGPSGSHVSRHEEWRDVQTDPCVLKHGFHLIRNLCCDTSQYQLYNLYSPSKKLSPAEDYSEHTRKLSDPIISCCSVTLFSTRHNITVCGR